MKPSFFIAGPPKCASSSLYFYLNQHPDIQMSLKKETRFFSNEYEKGLDYYLQSYFPDVVGKKVAGEATPSYAFLPFAAQRIHKHFPQAKIIFSFRHPAERAFSGWLMRKENGSETLSFIEAMEANKHQAIDFSSSDFESHWLSEHIHGNTRPGEIIRTYIEGSQYNRILDLYEGLFGKENILIVPTEVLRTNLDEELQKVYRFIGVEDQFTIPAKEEQNNYRKARFSSLIYILKRPEIKTVMNMLPRSLKKGVAKGLTVQSNKPTLGVDERKYANTLFSDMIDELALRWGRDLNHWKR